MNNLFKWRMPPDLLREQRDSNRFRSLLSCLFSGVFFGVIVCWMLSLFLWKTRTPFPSVLILIGVGVAFVLTILRYWSLPSLGPSVILLNESIYLQYGSAFRGRTYKYRFANITECRMRPVAGKTSHYTLMSVTSNLEREPAFFRWRLNEKLDIGIPNSIDCGKVEQILRSGGVNVING